MVSGSITINGSTWNNISGVSDSNAILLQSLDVNTKLRYVPNANYAGSSGNITYRAWDQSAGSNGDTAVDVMTNGGVTAYSSGTETASLSVTAVNDAPTISGIGVLTDIIEDDTNSSGDSITNLVHTSISDIDAGAVEGVAIVGIDNTNGQWQYTINGSTWNSITSASDSNAILLLSGDVNTKIRFVPDSDYNGSSGNITYRAWDRTSGSNGDTGVNVSSNGGTTAYSSATDTAALIVTPFNDAPLLDNSGTMSLPSISEDNTSSTGANVADIIASAGGDRISDIDVGAVEGIAVYSLGVDNGSWEYKIGAGSWTAVGTVSTNKALLLSITDSLRYVPDTYNSETATFNFYAWDRTSGSAGNKVNVSTRGGTTAFSSGSESVSIVVTAINDAPSVSGNGQPSNVLVNDTTPPGDTITTLVGNTISDGDTGASEGVALVGVSNTNGQWQYTINGSTWNNISGLSDSNAILLQGSDSNTRVRFVPNTSFEGTGDDITYRAWDMTSGSNGDTGVDVSVNGGTTAFSSMTETASVAVNNAPVLDNTGSMRLSTIIEGDSNPAGDSVGDIISSAGGNRITDINSGAVEGIAVTNVDDSNGTWYYSMNNGGVWTAFGAVSDSSAVLLDDASTTKVRFIPDSGYHGEVSLTFRAWDRTWGSSGDTGVDTSSNGGGSAYSTATETVDIGINPLNFYVTEIDGTNGFRLNGEVSGQQTGWSVDDVGDINGDGFDDFMIGSDFDGAGTREVYVIYGKSGAYSNPMSLSAITSSDGFNILDSGGQKFGKYIGGIGDINNDGYDDVIVGDYHDDTNGSNAGAAYVVFGSGSLGASIDVSSLNGSNGFAIYGRDASDDLGRDVAGIGDINSDGYDDFIIGAQDATPNGTDSGEAYVIFGKGSSYNASYSIGTLADGTQGFQLNGVAVGDQAGGSLGGGGDYNNDGYQDFLIAASTADTTNGSNSGEAYVVFGKASAYASTIELSSLSGSDGFTIAGLASSDGLGLSIKHGGDVNGDGIDDFIVTAYNSNVNGSDSGQTYVIFGSNSAFPASFDLTTLNGSNGFRLNGIGSSDQSGQGAVTVGDFNADGYDDIIIGSDRNIVTNDTGQAYLLYGTSSFSATIELSALDGSDGFYINGTVTNSRFSNSRHEWLDTRFKCYWG